MQDEVARSLGLSASDMKCYNILSSYGSMAPSELARRSGFTTGGITKILDHLEARGAIRRHSETNDRRSLTIELLSPRWGVNGDKPVIDFESASASLVEHYSPQEQAIIEDFLERSAEQLQAMTDQIKDARKLSAKP